MTGLDMSRERVGVIIGAAPPVRATERERPMQRRPVVKLHKGRHALLASFTCVLVLAACTVKLAPDYDPGILDALTKANELTLTHFAAVSSGVPPKTFATREATYNGLIGKFDAVRVQVSSRPTPQSMIAKLFGIGPSGDSQRGDIEILEAPTASVLETIISTLTEMRDTDREEGLKPFRVQGFKRSYETSIDQALTYEKALER